MLGDANRRVLEDRKLLADALREPPQDLDVERQLGDVVRERVRLQGIGLVAPEHEPAALVTIVPRGVRTPSIPRAPISNPVASVCASSTAPSCSAARQ